ncbi:thiosulfate-binding protein SoxY [Methylobacillus rhizosphaerae]|uniref:Thiosulfate-binding protein SoxY n=1 Tax=Methylobacillus rhizosphaerae TaxID=551994 RepID=A0A238Z7M1_9PROT|nr:thiosulfate oxidation carrier protein SoxY [Methylobacillus rhizosphaerae]SNR78833.1 thiosulfate-binding protein SoxY [Methylobacillus rhizosphaerae]
MATAGIKRRRILQWCAVSLLMPWQGIAAVWRESGKSVGSDGEDKAAARVDTVQDGMIDIVLPAFAEEGSAVTMSVMSHIAGTEAIAIFAEKNFVPLIANFSFAQGACPCIRTDIMLAASQDVEVVVQAAGKYYQARCYVTVT